jgi:hypothetical protein
MPGVPSLREGLRGQGGRAKLIKSDTRANTAIETELLDCDRTSGYVPQF